MDSHHQVGPPGQTSEDQVLGGDLFVLSIKECEIINFFLEASLKDEVLKIMPHRSRFSLARGPGSRYL
jgi:hypothetical protein